MLGSVCWLCCWWVCSTIGVGCLHHGWRARRGCLLMGGRWVIYISKDPDVSVDTVLHWFLFKIWGWCFRTAKWQTSGTCAWQMLRMVVLNCIGVMSV
jgi:hypothetical protein